LQEYQLALEQAAKNWVNINSPEATLMAFIARADQLVEKDGSLVKAFDSPNPEQALRHILKELRNNLKGITNE
jgi:hypothetical protein